MLRYRSDLAEEPLRVVVACLSSAGGGFQRRLVRAHRRRRQRGPHYRVAAHRLQALQMVRALFSQLQAMYKGAMGSPFPSHAEQPKPACQVHDFTTSHVTLWYHMTQV